MAVDDLYVPNGVFLKCDQGATINTLIVNPKKHKLYGEVIATETDNMPLANIMTFGMCSANASACIPTMPQWKNIHEGGTTVEGKKPLLHTSFCKCQQGGTIDIFFSEAEAIKSLESDKKERVDEIPVLDDLIGFALMGPTGFFINATGGDVANVGRGFRKGAKGTWHFLSHDAWQGETWKGMGKTIMTGIVGYVPPVTANQYGPPSQEQSKMMSEWIQSTPEKRIADFDKGMGTDLTSTHEGIKQAYHDFKEKKIKNGTRAEGEVMTGEVAEFVVELVVGGKGVNYALKGAGKAIKGLKETESFAKMSEATSKAITTINEFVKASKLGKLAESIKGIFKVGKTVSFLDKVTPLLKTGADEAFFWSGRVNGDGVMNKALEIAKSKGSTTLEGLIDKKGIKMPEWNFNDPSSIKMWEDVSAAYANQVSGEVRAVLGTELRPGNIWETVELPRLKENPNVTKITTINAETLEEKIIFIR